jgi:hypothetical protein
MLYHKHLENLAIQLFRQELALKQATREEDLATAEVNRICGCVSENKKAMDAAFSRCEECDHPQECNDCHIVEA